MVGLFFLNTGGNNTYNLNGSFAKTRLSKRVSEVFNLGMDSR